MSPNIRGGKIDDELSLGRDRTALSNTIWGGHTRPRKRPEDRPESLYVADQVRPRGRSTDSPLVPLADHADMPRTC